MRRIRLLIVGAIALSLLAGRVDAQALRSGLRAGAARIDITPKESELVLASSARGSSV